MSAIYFLYLINNTGKYCFKTMRLGAGGPWARWHAPAYRRGAVHVAVNLPRREAMLRGGERGDDRNSKKGHLKLQTRVQ